MEDLLQAFRYKESYESDFNYDSTHSKGNVSNALAPKVYSVEAKPVKLIKCYNCSKVGSHFAINCPEPQRKDRCSKCNRSGHTWQQCPSKQLHYVGNSSFAIPNKIIQEDGTQHEINSLLDSGSPL